MRTLLQRTMLLLLAGFAGLTANADTAPDSGQTTRELQQEQERKLKKPKAIPPLTTDKETPPPAGLDQSRIQVLQIRVTGSTVYSASELEALVADIIGGTHSLTELELAASRISAHYRKHGYFLSNAYLPVQDIQNGVLEIAVLEGRVDQITLDNTSRISNERIRSYLKDLPLGSQSPMDRPLLLLRDSIGVASMHAVLQPGASVGTSDLLVHTTPTAPYSGSVQLDNHGNRYTGEYRVNAAMTLHSPLKIGDQFSARVIGSDRDLAYGRISYQLPIGSDGMRLGAAVTHTQYQLDREFKSLDAHGVATSASLFTSYPLIVSQNGSFIGALTYEDKHLKDHIDSTDSNTTKSVKLATLGLSGNYQDEFNGAGQSSFDVGMTYGHLGMNASQRETDELTARSNGDFVKMAYALNRLQRLTDRETVSVSVLGQFAANNLNSSEKFSLGGAYGVRAYPQGEGSGDQGEILNLELRHRFMPRLQGILFYDYGHIKINHDPFAAGDNTRSIAGAGIGLNAQVFNNIRVDSYLAWRTQGGTPLSEPASAEHSPRLWVQASFDF